MSCSGCNGIDVFPLLKSKCDTGSGATGPTGARGPRGARGPAGEGVASNYLCVIDNGNVTLPNNSETTLPFNNQVSNSGWTFTQSSNQTQFTVPEDGTYDISVDLQALITGDIGDFDVGDWEIISRIYINDLQVDAKTNSRTNLRIGSIADQTSIHTQIIIELTTGLNINIRAIAAMTNFLASPQAVMDRVSLKIQRIA